MTITQILTRAHVIPVTMQRGRARVAAVITVLCLAAGCNSSFDGLGPPDEQMWRDLEACGEEPTDQLSAPPGSYVDHGLALDYARLAPPWTPKQGDQDYTAQVMSDPSMLEQVYADAAGGHVTARWLVCTFEAGTRGVARAVARKLAGLRCQTIPTCSFPDQKLPYSDATASGVRILTLIADDFEAEAQRLQVAQEIVGHMLTLHVGTRALGVRVKAGPATLSRPAPYRPGGTKPSGSGTAAGAAKRAAKPVYKPFTWANFRHNLAQRTGGIPHKGQAHHVLPVKFEDKFSKAGINIHDPKFGAWWKAGDHQSVAKAYNKRWQEFFDDHPNPTSEQILQRGRKIAKEHGLAIGF